MGGFKNSKNYKRRGGLFGTLEKIVSNINDDMFVEKTFY